MTTVAGQLVGAGFTPMQANYLVDKLIGGDNSAEFTSIALNTTDSATSGTNAKNTVDVAVAPTGSSTQVLFSMRYQMTYNSAQNMAAGGYLCPVQYVVNTAGAGTHDKIVGSIMQHNVTGGNVTALLGHESELSSVGASTLVGSYAAYYVPNMASVTNISNVTSIYSFACDHYNSYMKNSGRYMKTMDASGAGGIMREVPAAYHAGYVTGQYYGPRGRSSAVAPIALTQYIVYAVPHHIMERTAFTKVGLRVTTNVAASTIRIAIYQVTGGQLSSLVVDAGTVSSATTGAKEATIAATLEAGMYAIVIQSSHAGVSVNGVTVPSLMDVFGIATDTAVDATPYYNPGAVIITSYPDPFGQTLAYSDTSLAIPFVWLRK